MTAGGTGKAPALPVTRLALRAWRLDRERMVVRSLNAPSKKAPWFAKALASPAGAWPYRQALVASCPSPADAKHEEPVPAAECTCGIYATTDLGVINGYLSKDAPVLGIVEMGGRIIPATNGYRAAYARVAAILLIDEMLTEPHAVLRKLAAAYSVPAIVPFSSDPEDFRELTSTPSLAAEAEEYLRGLNGPMNEEGPNR
jgi:hypothetical protein